MAKVQPEFGIEIDTKKEFREMFDDVVQVDNKNLEYHERWEGVVIDNDDPEKLGRVKIRIYTLYDNIPQESIPWAVPDITFIGSTVGNFIVPENNTILRGYFDMGDIQKPIYDSIAYNIDHLNDSEVDYTEDYPHKMTLLETDQGDYLTLNRKTGELAFIHRTGACFFVKQSGEIEISPGTDTDSGTDSDLVLTVNGNLKATVQMDCDIKAQGSVYVDAGVMVELGKNVSKMFVNNLPNCLVTGAPHQINNTNVTC